MEDWIRQANDLLKEIGDRKRAVAIVNSRYESQVAELRKRQETETQKDRDAIQSMENDLMDLMKNTPGLFSKKKTKNLAFGVLKARKTPASLELDGTDSWETVLCKLRAHRLNRFIQVKESPDKAMIKKKMSDEDMEKIGVKKVQEVRYDYQTI